MESFAEIKNAISKHLKTLENELWKSFTQATKDQDLNQIDRIRFALERRKIVELEARKMFDSLTIPQTSPPKGTLPPVGKRRRKYPKSIRIGDYEEQIRYLNQIPVVTANWILNQGRELPEIQNFVHRDNNDFMPSAALKKLRNGWYIEVGDDKQTLINKARNLLDQTGFESTHFSVEMHDGESVTR